MAIETTSKNPESIRRNWAFVRMPLKFWWWSLPVFIVTGFIENSLYPVPGLFPFDMLVGILFWIVWPLYLAFNIDSLTSHLMLHGLDKFGWGVALFRLSIVVPGLTAVAFGLVSIINRRPIVGRALFSVVAFVLWLTVRGVSGTITPKGLL